CRSLSWVTTACRGATTSTSPSFRSGTCSRRQALRSSRPVMCCRWGICSCRSITVGGPGPIHGARRGSSGSRLRGRRSTTSPRPRSSSALLTSITSKRRRMSLKESLLTPAARRQLEHSILVRERLEEQFRDLEQQHSTATLGVWGFLATEVMVFGTLFGSLGVYRWMYGEAFEKASEHLNWIIGGVNTLVLLVSSFTVVMAVHFAQVGKRQPLFWCLIFTASLGCVFLCLKGVEYYIDYR